MFSDSYQKKILAQLFNGGAVVQPNHYTLGLSLTDPLSPDGVIEPNGGGYGRVTIGNNTADITAPTPDTFNGGNFISNVNLIQFPSVTADWTNGAHDTVSHWVLFDDSNNLVAIGKLGAQRKIMTGDSVSFDPNSLTLTLK